MFERPQKATSGRLSWGKSSGCLALLTNRAELILTTHSAKGYGTNRTTFIVTRDCLSQKTFSASPVPAGCRGLFRCKAGNLFPLQSVHQSARANVSEQPSTLRPSIQQNES